MAPATKAVSEVETRAQRPSVVASAAPAPPKPRLMRVVKRARCAVSRRLGMKAGSVLCVQPAQSPPASRPPSYSFAPRPSPCPVRRHITVTARLGQSGDYYKELFRLHFGRLSRAPSRLFAVWLFGLRQARLVPGGRKVMRSWGLIAGQHLTGAARAEVARLLGGAAMMVHDSQLWQRDSRPAPRHQFLALCRYPARGPGL